jgi:DNA-binding response OmpR family regulator
LYLPDINLTDGSGLELCRKIRETSEIPILFLIANDTKYKLLLVGQQERQIFSEAEDTLTACLQQQLLKLRNILTAQNQMLAQEKEQNILLLCRWHLENQPF